MDTSTRGLVIALFVLLLTALGFSMLMGGMMGPGMMGGQKAELDALTLTGRLDYQACDDKVCFNPVSVPLTWTLTVAPLDGQRANLSLP